MLSASSSLLFLSASMSMNSLFQKPFLKDFVIITSCSFGAAKVISADPINQTFFKKNLKRILSNHPPDNMSAAVTSVLACPPQKWPSGCKPTGQSGQIIFFYCFCSVVYFLKYSRTQASIWGSVILSAASTPSSRGPKCLMSSTAF